MQPWHITCRFYCVYLNERVHVPIVQLLVENEEQMVWNER